MKKLFNILILLSLCLTLQAQIEFKPIALKSGLMFVSGCFDANAEVLRINYNQFDAVFTNANQQFWNPDISYQNKWKNGDYKQGEKFLFSSTALVWTTDGYHLMRTLRNCTMVAALTINIGDKKPFKQYLIEALIYYVSYTAGFNFTYNLIYKMP